ncbi:MAG: hypothetical protein ACYS72_05555, partial [Planctomycetota bacterium]
MTLQITPAAEPAKVLKFQQAADRVCIYNLGIKINQVAIIHRGSLGRTNPVRIMTGRTGYLIVDMFR